MYPTYSFAPHMGGVVYVLTTVIILFKIEKYKNHAEWTIILRLNNLRSFPIKGIRFVNIAVEKRLIYGNKTNNIKPNFKICGFNENGQI